MLAGLVGASLSAYVDLASQRLVRAFIASACRRSDAFVRALAAVVVKAASFKPPAPGPSRAEAEVLLHWSRAVLLALDAEAPAAKKAVAKLVEIQARGGGGAWRRGGGRLGEGEGIRAVDQREIEMNHKGGRVYTPDPNTPQHLNPHHRGHSRPQPHRATSRPLMPRTLRLACAAAPSAQVSLLDQLSGQLTEAQFLSYGRLVRGQVRRRPALEPEFVAAIRSAANGSGGVRALLTDAAPAGAAGAAAPDSLYEQLLAVYMDKVRWMWWMRWIG